EQAVHDVGQTGRVGARCQLHSYHVGIDEDRLHSLACEKATSELVGRTIAAHLLTPAVALVPHAGEAPVQLEEDDVGAAAALLGDGDGLAHGSGDHTATASRPGRSIG